MDKNLAVVGLTIVYVVAFKCLQFRHLGQPRNPILREHILDCRRSNPFNAIFMQFIEHLDLDIDFDCLVKELRFADLYISMPLLADGDLGSFFDRPCDGHIKSVDLPDTDILPRPAHHTKTLYHQRRI